MNPKTPRKLKDANANDLARGVKAFFSCMVETGKKRERVEYLKKEIDELRSEGCNKVADLQVEELQKLESEIVEEDEFYDGLDEYLDKCDRERDEIFRKIFPKDYCHNCLHPNVTHNEETGKCEQLIYDSWDSVTLLEDGSTTERIREEYSALCPCISGTDDFNQANSKNKKYNKEDQFKIESLRDRQKYYYVENYKEQIGLED